MSDFCFFPCRNWSKKSWSDAYATFLLCPCIKLSGSESSSPTLISLSHRKLIHAVAAAGYRIHWKEILELRDYFVSSKTDSVKYLVPGTSSGIINNNWKVANILFVLRSVGTMTNKNQDNKNQTIATECFLFSVANETLDSLSDDSADGRSNETLLATYFEWDVKKGRLMQQGGVSHQVQILLGVLLILFVVFGIFANSVILYVFSRYRAVNKSGISFSFRHHIVSDLLFTRSAVSSSECEMSLKIALIHFVLFQTLFTLPEILCLPVK